MIYNVLVLLRFFLQNNILQYFVAGVGNQMSDLRQRPGRSSMRTTLSVQCHLVRFHHIKYIFLTHYSCRGDREKPRAIQAAITKRENQQHAEDGLWHRQQDIHRLRETFSTP